jgi:hypothetical protein
MFNIASIIFVILAISLTSCTLTMSQPFWTPRHTVAPVPSARSSGGRSSTYVEGMEFYGYHGVFEEENKLGQRFKVDLTAELDLSKATVHCCTGSNFSRTVSAIRSARVSTKLTGSPSTMLQSRPDCRTGSEQSGKNG